MTSPDPSDSASARASRASTKDRILDAAEELFAAHGFDGTSLRVLTQEADVNLAAVHYHFGSKEGLLDAVFGRRIDPVNLERVRRLDALEREFGVTPIPVEALLRTFLEPPLHMVQELGPRGARFLRLVGRAHSDTDPRTRATFLGKFREIFERFGAALSRTVPTLSPDELHWRMHFMVGSMAHALTWLGETRCLALRGTHATSPERILPMLVAYTAAGMRCAPTPATPPSVGHDRERREGSTGQAEEAR